MLQQFKDATLEEQERIIALFYDRFAGRLDTYAIRFEFPDATAYIPSTYRAADPEKAWLEKKVAKVVDDIGTAEFCDKSIRAHLEGRHLLGIYPITADSKVHFFAMDFDKKKDDDPDPYGAAVEQATVLATEAGLHVYIERSQGGKGFHVWGFLSEAIDAGRLRHALAPFIVRADTYDRMFPNQDGISETRPLGNLIALPFHADRMEGGNSTFVVRDALDQPIAVSEPFALLDDVKLIEPAKIDELFDAAGTYVIERDHTTYAGESEGLTDSYKLTHPIFGCEFIRWCYEQPDQVTEPLWYAMLCQFSQLENGRALAHEWSARDVERYDARATDRKYNQALKTNKPHSCEVIRGLGGNCECDRRFPGKVYHPFDLTRIHASALIQSIALNDESASATIYEGIGDVIDWLALVQEDPTLGRGLPTGIRAIDRSFGFRMGELTVLAARNSIGKTALGLQWALDLALYEKVATKFYSLEMTKRQVWQRVLSPISGVTQTRMTTGQMTEGDWTEVRQAKEDIRNTDFHVDDRSMHLDTILESAARFAMEHPRCVIFVDYLQIIPRLSKENEQDQIARSMTQLKNFAKMMNCHVVVLCQLNRGADDATSESKTFDSWLRGSGVIEFVADNIIIILGEKGPGVVERIATIHKQRNGEAGLSIHLAFNQPIMRFGEAGQWKLSEPLMPGASQRANAPMIDERPHNAAGEVLDGDLIAESMASLIILDPATLAEQIAAEAPLPPGYGLPDKVTDAELATLVLGQPTDLPFGSMFDAPGDDD